MRQFPYTFLGLLVSLAVCGILSLMYRRKREGQFLSWLATWGFLSGHYAFEILRLRTDAPWTWVADRWLFFLAMLGLVWVAGEYGGSSRSRAWFVALAAAGLLWGVVHAYGWVPWRASIPSASTLAALVAATSFWRSRRLHGSIGVRLLAGGSLLLAVATPAVTLHFEPIAQVAGIFSLTLMAVGMVILAYENTQRRIENNMMGCSILNLAASSLQTDADLAGMLEKVLDRVLDVYGVDQGMMVVHPGDREPPTRLFRGLPAEFAVEWERRALDEFVSARVARLGGLVMMRDMDDPATLRALDGEAGLDRFRELLRLAGLRTLAAISVQSKSRVYGTLLVVHPPHRTFSAAELRMLASLGAQVGMGVENFLLMKHAARRTEELNLLNQTGQAISSTLETEPLLRQIHLAIQKLMDARNFYVALHDEARDEIRFELEVEDGVYLPRRTRKKRQALTEYILRSGQPLLIHDNMDRFRREHGVELSGRPARSWCGAPIIIRDRPAGVLAVQSYEREGAYDQGHLEVLTILAAQASVALENARLFGEEQKRLRQLTFLHNITRVAISTLNAEEMLAEIAREIQKNFAYDHIGIGLVNYQTKEVELKAEAGLSSQAPGKRIPLDSGLVGRAARSGQLVLVNDVASEARFTGILTNARSALSVPIVYADQVLGVLNIESVQAGAFSQEDLPILRTLADHLATALHNAFTFQHTQEQAITDGLTGAKTRRYFMESLHGEWRRSTRAGRVFSLVLVDLDRFKQVNDTLGHLEGDLVLAKLGKILEQRCRQSNVVARYGGDEFMVLMPETATEQAQILAERLRLWLATEPIFAEHGLTASFGLATFPVHGHTPEEIIRAADAGLYLAKHEGGNRVAVAEQFRLGQVERWQGHVLSSYLQNLTRRIDSTGPDILENLIRHAERSWPAVPGEPQELARAVVEGLNGLAEMLERRAHGGAGGHHQKVARYATLLARGLNLSEPQVEQVYIAARLHDIGYLAVSSNVLNNRGKLSPLDFSALQVHAPAGARLLEAMRLDSAICQMVRYHHEFVNGRGYPDGLPGERIPLGARILAVADAYDALTAPRPYRDPSSLAQALDELERFAGTQFDDLLVKTFVRLMKKEAGQEVVSSQV